MRTPTPRNILAILLTSATLLALTVTSSARTRQASPRSSSTTRGEIHVASAGEPVLVRTVAAPGRMSPEMRAALQGLSALDPSGDTGVRSQRRPDGTLLVLSTSRFLHFTVGSVEAGVASGRCVASLDDVFRAPSPDRVHAVRADRE